MKLARFGNPGAEKPGLVDDQGRLRDLSNVIADLTPANLSRSALQKIAAIAPSTLPLVAGETRFGAPIAGVGKFIAIGLNYADHAAEANLQSSDGSCRSRRVGSTRNAHHGKLQPVHAGRPLASTHRLSQAAVRTTGFPPAKVIGEGGGQALQI